RIAVSVFAICETSCAEEYARIDRETRVVSWRPSAMESAAMPLDLRKARGHRIGRRPGTGGEDHGSADRSDRVGCRAYANGHRRYQGRPTIGTRQARLDG